MMSEFNVDDLLDAIENDADASYEAFIKGRKVRFDVRAPDHVAHLKGDRHRYALLEKLKDKHEAGVQGVEDVQPVHDYISAHIVSIGGQDWTTLERDKRVRLLRALTARDFWGLIATINTAGRLTEEEGND